MKLKKGMKIGKPFVLEENMTSEAAGKIRDVAVLAATRAGMIIRRNFGKVNKFSLKPDKSIVTEIDLAANEAILSTIQKAYPSHEIFSEETGFTKHTSPYLWVIDPLDGSSNFARGVPFFSSAIAVRYNNKTLVSVVYNPITFELFTAIRGVGAFLNGKKIQVDNTVMMDDAYVLVNRGPMAEERERCAKICLILARAVRSYRFFGSASLENCYVACHRFDAVINNNSQFYDSEAGNLVALEAGARVTNFSGLKRKTKERDDLLITTKTLHFAFVMLLKGI